MSTPLASTMEYVKMEDDTTECTYMCIEELATSWIPPPFHDVPHYGPGGSSSPRFVRCGSLGTCNRPAILFASCTSAALRLCFVLENF